MNREMELAKRIYQAWAAGVYPPHDLTDKQKSVVAARVALGRDEDGKRDLIFEALCSAMGADWNEMPKAEQSKYNAATKQLREINATPSEIVRRARRYEFLHKDWPLTPTALVSHWSSLSGKTTPDTTRQIFSEPETPEEELVGPPPEFLAMTGVMKILKDMSEL